jgi:CDP-glucose 4,6-dehydratase
MKADFWRTKSVLVTGADGFVAANLIYQLLGLGASVTGIMRTRKAFSRLRALGVDDQINQVVGTITDFDLVCSTLSKFEVDTVFHLGASSQVTVAAASPLDTFQSNVMGTWNILEASRLSNGIVKRIVVASSDKAYGDHRDSLPYKEEYTLRGLFPYDCSKSCTDLIAQTYFFTYKLPIRITRCTNIYGHGDLNFRRLIPATIIRTLLRKPTTVDARTAGVKREYLFITDAVEAYVQLMESIDPEDKGQDEKAASVPLEGCKAYSWCAYNIGGGKQNVKSVEEVIDSILEIMHAPKELKVTMPQDNHGETRRGYFELPNQWTDATKIRTEIGWKPTTRLIPIGLGKTIEWYEENFPKFEATARACFARYEPRIVR